MTAQSVYMEKDVRMVLVQSLSPGSTMFGPSRNLSLFVFGVFNTLPTNVAWR